MALLTMSVAVAGCGGRGAADEPSASGPGVVAGSSAEMPDCSRADWPGPWTACPEADWVRRIVRDAGYRISGETGSALVAVGRGRSFYIWTTKPARRLEEIARDERLRELAVVEGAAVYGDRDLWRIWQAQGYVFWVKQGPTDSSVVPRPAELAGLVQASSRIPPP